MLIAKALLISSLFWLAFEPAAAAPMSAISSIEHLEKKGDWRQVVIESLRNLKTLDSKSKEAFTVRFKLHRAMSKLVDIHIDETERTWVDWSIGVGGNTNLLQHQLKYSNFILDFPQSPETQKVLQWESEAVQNFLRREDATLNFYVNSGNPFPALFRLEGLINNESILRHQTRGLISRILSIRISIQENFDDFEDSQLKHIQGMSEGLASKPSEYNRKNFIRNFTKKTQGLQRAFRSKFRTSSTEY